MKRFALSLLLLALPCLVRAAEIPMPTGKVILSVTGSIQNKNQGDKALFDRKMLQDLGLIEMKTSTTWTNGVVVFEGVSAAKLLDYTGATGQTLTAIAINDYKVDLRIDELRKYPVMLALTMNGRDLELRDKGPIWIVYPRDQYPELAGEENSYKWIWQLNSMVVK
jgi:hypothetical protein